jgi:Kdo2-lipid IVA lauroyltransferase/acyltransferase
VTRERDVHTLVSALKAGEVVGIVCDQARRADGAWVPFFGHPAWMPVGPAKLARLTGATLLVGGIRREGWGRFTITLCPPLCTPDRPRTDFKAVTAEIARDLEGLVRENPAEWIWMYDHWGPEKASGGGAS